MCKSMYCVYIHKIFSPYYIQNTVPKGQVLKYFVFKVMEFSFTMRVQTLLPAFVIYSNWLILTM